MAALSESVIALSTWVQAVIVVLIVYELLQLLGLFGSGGGSLDFSGILRRVAQRRQPPPVGPPTPYHPPPQPPPGPSPKYDPHFDPGKVVVNHRPSPPRPQDRRFTPPAPPPKDKRVFVDHSPWFLHVKNQRGLGACTAFACCALYEYAHNRQQGKVDAQMDLSELFLYYLIRLGPRDDPHSGSFISDGGDTLRDNGVCREHFWPYIEAMFRIQAPPEAYADAPRQRSEQHVVMRRNTDHILSALLAGNVVATGIFVYHNFFSYRAGVYLQKGGNRAGGHAIVVVGFDSHHNDGAGNPVRAFKIRNSWGTGWGEHGYGWIAEDVFRDLQHDYPRLLLGVAPWQEKLKCRITGRVVLDDHKANPDSSGRDYVHHAGMSVPEPPYEVGVIAQMRGQLVTLHRAAVQDRSGLFSLEFELPYGQLQPLTLLPQHLPNFKDIHFAKLPAGVVVYRKSHEKEARSYFHIAHFGSSKLGRGGEGIAHPENPRSDRVENGLDFSGRPIVFTPKHTVEENVVIPVMETKEDVQELAELRNACRRKKIDAQKLLELGLFEGDICGEHNRKIVLLLQHFGAGMMQDNNGLLELLGEESQLLAEEQLGKLCRDYAELVKQENEALATLEELLKLYNCRSKKSMAAFAEKFPLLIRLRSSLHQLLTKDSDILGALENRLHG